MPTLTNIMEILKINKLTKHYNNIQQIYCGVTVAVSPTLTGKEEEKIIEMFQEVERSCRKYINRYNRILKKEEHEKYFKSLKYRCKLREYDSICRKICIEKGWEFYSSL